MSSFHQFCRYLGDDDISHDDDVGGYLGGPIRWSGVLVVVFL